MCVCSHTSSGGALQSEFVALIERPDNAIEFIIVNIVYFWVLWRNCSDEKEVAFERTAHEYQSGYNNCVYSRSQ